MGTLVCVSLTHPTPEAMVEASRRTSADLVEARLDHLEDPTPQLVRELADDLARPAIATLRPASEGGGFDGRTARRRELLKACLDAGYALVDVEDEAPARDALLHHADGSDARVLLSRHHHDATPSLADILAFARAAHERGAWGAKLAARVRGPDDAAHLARAAARARREGLRLAVMGLDDPVLRLAAPALGIPLAYAAPDDAGPAAPGQPLARVLQAAHADLAPSEVTAGTDLVLLLGHPVDHSLSPAMQTEALRARGVDAVYLAADVPPGHVGEAVEGLRALGILGANVTAPHKRAVLDHVDEVEPSAKAAGSANTLVRDGDRLVATSTDGVGALRALEAAGVPVDGARCLILGAGGAARAVAHALRDAAAELTVANRTPERATELARAVGGGTVPLDDVPDAVPDHDVLLDCTSVGHRDDASLVPADALRPGLAVLDAVYRPGGTRLVRDAREAGSTVVPGEALLLHQGAASFERWTTLEAPVGAMRRVLEDAMEVSTWTRGR